MPIINEMMAFFKSLSPIIQAGLIIIVILLLIGFFRFATELFFRILAVGCAIIVLIALAWVVYTYVLH